MYIHQRQKNDSFMGRKAMTMTRKLWIR